MEYAPDQVSMAPPRTAAQLARTGPRAAGVQAEQFPTDGLTSYDENDKVMMAKLKLQDDLAKPGMTKFGKLEAKDSDFKWMQKKEAAVDAANFQEWFAKEFDLMSPAQKKRAKELYPEFYAQRKKLLKQQTKNLFDLARIKLEGIESREDLMKTYMAETGRLDVGPLQNLLHPEAADTWSGNAGRNNEKRFQRGLANPFSVFGKEAIGKSRADEQKAYAARAYNANDTTDLGSTSGFGGMAAGAGDSEWYTKLMQ